MSDDSFDPVAGLLRRSGRRPEPPADRAARIRENVHAAWRADVARRQRTRWLAVAASVLVVVGATFGALSLRSPTAPLIVAHVTENADSVTIEHDGRTQAADTGASLNVGDVLHVAGSTGATLLVARGDAEASLRLAPGSRIEWTSADEVRLHEGQLYLDIVSDRRGDHAPLGVVAGDARIEHVGTRFMTSKKDDVVDVAVRDGSVRVRYAGSALMLGGGERAVLKDGAADRSRLAPGDVAWEWAETLSPRIELEGRSLLAVLRDLTSEAGLELRFASLDVERQAAATTLHGPALRQPPRAALQSVVDTTLFQIQTDAANGRVILQAR